MNYPFRDLVALLEVTATPNEFDPRDSQRMSRREIQTRLGLSSKTWVKYSSDGVPHERSNLIAERAGFHPAEVWPEWHDNELAAIGLVCDECGEFYVPAWRGLKPGGGPNRFCGTRCRQRKWARETRRADPVFREKERVRRRAYYEECGEYERRRNLRWKRERKADG